MPINDDESDRVDGDGRPFVDVPENVVIYLRAETCDERCGGEGHHADECTGGRIALHIDNDLPAHIVFSIFNLAIEQYVRQVALRTGKSPELVDEQLARLRREHGGGESTRVDMYERVPGNPFGAIDPLRGFGG